MAEIPEPPAGPNDLRREVEEKIVDLEKRLDDVERRLAERTRLAREGQPWADDDVAGVPPEKPDPIAD